MPKASLLYSPSSCSATSSKDNSLLALAQRHDLLWRQWDSLGDDDPRVASICREADELERTIMATPAFTPEGHIARLQVFHRAGFEDEDGILALSLEIEAKRVGAVAR